jgi:hypothetical protein
MTSRQPQQSQDCVIINLERKKRFLCHADYELES